MDRDTARIIGGLYYAITSALPRETAGQIHQIVLGYDNPHNSSAERVLPRVSRDSLGAV
jgi:hypothetical protein